MHTSLVGLLFLAWVFQAPAAAAKPGTQIVSMAVGQVKDHVLTSREVILSEAAEKILFGAAVGDLKIPQDVESAAFAKIVTATLLEWVVYLESKSMALPAKAPEELVKAQAKLKPALVKDSKLKAFKFSDKEIQMTLERKLAAKNLIQFRAESSVVPVSDAEAEKYFNQNRLRFGSLPFDNFKASIKTFLSRQQVERRLKDWFEVLQSKYQVRNFLAEI